MPAFRRAQRVHPVSGAAHTPPALHGLHLCKETIIARMHNNRGGGSHRKVDVKPPSTFPAPTPINNFISIENEQ